MSSTSKTFWPASLLGPGLLWWSFPTGTISRRSKPFGKTASGSSTTSSMTGTMPPSGGWWYDHEFVAWLLGYTHLLTASAPSLVRSLREKSGRDVVEVPNGVNARIFDLPPIGASSPRPPRRRRASVRLSRLAVRRLVRLVGSRSSGRGLPRGEDHPDRRSAPTGPRATPERSSAGPQTTRGSAVVSGAGRYRVDSVRGLEDDPCGQPAEGVRISGDGSAGGSASPGTPGGPGLGLYPPRPRGVGAQGAGVTATRSRRRHSPGMVGGNGCFGCFGNSISSCRRPVAPFELRPARSATTPPKSASSDRQPAGSILTVLVTVDLPQRWRTVTRTRTSGRRCGR